jgi:dynein heavy chain
MQTELIDKEIREIEFVFMNGPKSDCRLVKQIELVIGQFNEIMLRIQVLKTSPYVKNFLEKLLELEKMGKSVLEVLDEFETLQKKWLYLQNIFSQDSLQESLAEEMKIWRTVDKFFKVSIKWLIDQP